MLVLLLLTNLFFVLSKKLDTDRVVVFKPPNLSVYNQGFGSTVAMIKSAKIVRFIIGAPKGNSNSIGIQQTGLVYSCKLRNNWTTTDCDEISLTTKDVRQFSKSKSLFTSGMSLGLNLAVDRENNLLTVCGHLHTYNNQQPSGICFLVDAITGNLVNIISPKSRKLSMKKPTFKSFHSHEMFGFSSTFASKSGQIFIGVPGYDIFRGAILTLTNNSQITMNTVNELDQDSYLGYSLTSGTFFKSHPELIAVSAPRGQQLKGQVFIMKVNPDDYYGDIVQSLQGQQFGEYFGYSIVSVDLNNDGYHDLLIGAPLYMPKNNPRGDCGRVYIHFSDGHRLINEPVIIEGDSLFGSRFGSSIAIIGDLDGDGVNDFAVGAPQENDGSGSVYIYSGSSIKTSKKYLQKIDSSKLFNLLGFGSSIYSGIDVDDNGCPDLLIGAYMSDTVVLLRCTS